MAIPPNIEKFNTVAAQTFAALYESFPFPCDLRLKEEYGIWLFGPLYEPGQKEELAEVRFIEATLNWLQEAGYLRYEGFSCPTGFMQAVLTIKGLEALNATPDVLTSTSTAGELVTKALERGAAESLSETMKFILAKGLELASHSIL